MKIISTTPEFTFDDVLLLPNKSTFPINHEEEKINLATRISKNIKLDIPIVSSPMPGVTEEAMAIAIGKTGGMGFLHFFQSFEKQLEQVGKVKKEHVKVAACIADLSKNGIKHVGNLLKVGADLISVETYSAHNSQAIAFVNKLKKTFSKVEVSVALVATGEATYELIKAGADSIRVGIGGGSHCTTRLVTGVGRPQLSAVADCYKIAKKYNIPIISDTGIKYPGDIAKALVFGADCVMIGGLFAGTEETPGKVITKKGKKYKYTWGMCTETAIKHNQIERHRSFDKIIKLVQEKSKNRKLFEEGVEGLVSYKGSVLGVIEELTQGTRRSMWYQGVKNIANLRRKARVVLASPNTKLENAPRI